MAPGPMSTATLVYRTHGLGTTAEIALSDAGRLVEAAELLHEELERIDRLASRFRDDSELSALHRQRGRPVEVSPELFAVIRAALDMAAATDGALDPTVGEAMCRLGYDRDFSLLAGGSEAEPPGSGPVPGWRRVELDSERCTVEVPAGTRLDLGATAKAWAADRAADRAAHRFGCGALVSLGGDVAVTGQTGTGFPVALVDRCGEAPADEVETIAVRSGGVATSGTTKRRWRCGGRLVHHIVDPATGLPAVTPWRTVSVVAASCVSANAAATAALVKGSTAPAWLRRLGLPSRLVANDGRVSYTGSWPQEATLGRRRAR
jgi:thiamine biosynthesis lipoprotein ApbE